MGKKSPGSPSRGRKRVILYCGGDPATRDNSFFFLNLFWKLMMRGREKGFEMVPVMDGRPLSQLDSMPDDVAALLESGDIDGIIGIMLFQSMVAWMEESGLPHAVLFPGPAANHLGFDISQMIDISFTRLAELGCTSVGLMIPNVLADAELMEHMEEAGRRLRLKLELEWILVSRNSREISGYNYFFSLWELKSRPDGLVVFPDVTARGVVTAALEKNVKAPAELKLILHRNEEIPYPSPIMCDWLENSGAAMTDAMIGQLETQWEGGKLEIKRVPFRLIKGY